jgi:hypothetical protein
MDPKRSTLGSVFGYQKFVLDFICADDFRGISMRNPKVRIIDMLLML